MPSNAHRLPNYAVVPECALSFHPANAGLKATHPLRGLADFGPYSRGMSPALVAAPLRLAFVTIEGHASRLRDYLNSLEVQHTSEARSGYFPPFDGFEAVYGISLQVPQQRGDSVVLIRESDAREALTRPEPEREFLELLARSIRELMQRRAEFDVVVFYFPQFLESVFRVSNDVYDFDLHDAVKALTATVGLPSQVILDRSIDFADRCSVLWSLSLALYTKAGGIPWKLVNAAPHRTAFVGLSYVLRHETGRQSILTCCSQLFDDVGHGFQFLLFTADEIKWVGRSPFLTRAGMRRLLTRTLELYLRQAGELPSRVVVHKTTQFTRDERDGAGEALGNVGGYDLLQIQESTAWLAAKGRQGSATAFPVDRGTVLPLSRYSFLLWTQGDAWGIAERNRSYFQEAKGVPHPLLITQHAGETSLLDSANELLALTKMNWNTSRLYNNLPVTIGSASTLGRVSKYMPDYSALPYQFRLFM